MTNTNDQADTEPPKTETRNRLATEELETETPSNRELEVEEAKPPLHIKFEPPIEYDQETYSELLFDFDRMIGKDFQRAEREFTRLYKADRNETPLPEMKHLYHAIILAHAGYRPNEKAGSGVPLGLIQKLPRRYYTPLRLEALKACGSSPEEENQ
jgi:hypothetical protein